MPRLPVSASSAMRRRRSAPASRRSIRSCRSRMSRSPARRAPRSTSARRRASGSSAARFTTTPARRWRSGRGGRGRRAQRVQPQRDGRAAACGRSRSSAASRVTFTANIFAGSTPGAVPRIERRARRASPATTGSRTRGRSDRRGRRRVDAEGGSNNDDDRLPQRRPLRDPRGDRPRRHGRRVPRHRHANETARWR